jgi:hypothetical protein
MYDQLNMARRRATMTSREGATDKSITTASRSIWTPYHDLTHFIDYKQVFISLHHLALLNFIRTANLKQCLDLHLSFSSRQRQLEAPLLVSLQCTASK